MTATSQCQQVFVQHCQTELFLTEDQQWTDDEAQAHDFQNTINAVGFCLNHSLKNAQILVRVGTAAGLRETVVPLSCG